MSLSKYKEKRSFQKTPEPSGKTHKGAGELRFVVQKHQASHLHYDFRLEMEGVLKSWAVPKGPSLNPDDKRLAMMVEDHPFDYRSFEGIIPKGNYGAGTVIIWDEGSYLPADLPGGTRKEQEKHLLASLHKGNLKIILKGKKLKGEFVLVKGHRPDMENGWLLIKVNDKYASEKDITQKNKSVVSGKNLEQLAATTTNEWKSNRKTTVKKRAVADPVPKAPDWKELIKDKGRKSAFPQDVSPMLATLTDKPFNDPSWLFEIKWDGYRALGYVHKNKTALLSRNQISFSTKYKPVADALKNIGTDLVIDGEIVAVDDAGKVDFQQLQSWQKTGEGNLVYYVFDLLWIEGYSITHWPLAERKALLAQVLPQDPVIRYSDHIMETGEEFFKLASEKGLEGIMAKDGKGIYTPGARTTGWLKIKTSQRQEAVVAGFTSGRGSRKYFGALVLGIYDQGELKYIGHTGSGFNETSLDSIYKKLVPLVTDTCPFRPVPKTKMPVTWIRPKLVCEVKFQEWTRDGSMRHPIFMGLRTDKKPREVVREKVVAEETVVQKKTIKKSASRKKSATTKKPN